MTLWRTPGSTARRLAYLLMTVGFPKPGPSNSDAGERSGAVNDG